MAALEDAIAEQSTAARIIHSVPPPPTTLASLPVDLDNRAQGNLSEPGPIDQQQPEADNPLPARAVDTREKIIPVEVNRPRPAVLKKRYIIGAVLGLSFLALLCIFMFGTAWLLGKLNRPLFFGSAQPSSTPVNFINQATPTGAGDPGITPLAPSPSAHVNEFHLSLSAQKADNLLVINQGTVGVPLAQLRFGDQKGKLTGDEWGIEMLQPGQCVTVTKSPGHPEAPAAGQCELVGKNLTRGGPNKFWDSAFDVYFQNVFVASCDLKNTSCDLQFSNSP
jgi:hypothetical protein